MIILPYFLILYSRVNSDRINIKQISELISLYRMLQFVCYRVFESFRNWLAVLSSSAFLLIILTGFCLVECFRECGFFLTGIAIIVLCFTSTVCFYCLKLAAEITTLCNSFIATLASSKKLCICQKKELKSCAPVQIQCGSFFTVQRESCPVMLDIVVNTVIDLVVTY